MNRRWLGLGLGLCMASSCAPVAEAPTAETPTTGAPADAAALAGANYPEAQRIVQTYCSPCHSKQGADPHQGRGYTTLKLDTYEQFKSRAFLVRSAVAIHGDRADMPPVYAARQPSETERQTLIDWIDRNAPNTPTGL